jgi:two-component system chemotaxis sensor kinase CheA
VSDDFNFTTGMPSEEMAEYVQMFVDETSEQLDELIQVLLILESNPDSPSHLNESFRLIHSIKGAAAMMGLDSITLLTHHLENHFERLRSGLETLDKSLMDLILKCVDFLRNAVTMLREGRPLVSAPELIEQLARSLSEIRVAANTGQTTHQPEEPKEVKSTSQSQLTNENQQSPTLSVHQTSSHKRIIVYLDRTIALPELKAELIIARLSDLAVISRTSPDIDELASLSELRTLQVWLESSCDDSQLRSASDIVGVDLVEIDNVDFSAEADEQEAQLAIPHSISTSVDKPSHTEPEVPELGTVQVNHDQVLPDSKPVVSASKTDPTFEPTEPQPKVVETLRVDIQRLDRLMNLAGELVVNRAQFVQLASQMTDTFKKSGLISQLRDLCELLRESPFTGSQLPDVELKAAQEKYAHTGERSTQLPTNEGSDRPIFKSLRWASTWRVGYAYGSRWPSFQSFQTHCSRYFIGTRQESALYHPWREHGT